MSSTVVAETPSSDSNLNDIPSSLSSTTTSRKEEPRIIATVKKGDKSMMSAEATKEQPVTRSLLLEKELQHSKADAQETLTAFLQFAEGVRAITRHMQQQTTCGTSQEEEKEESNDDDGESSPAEPVTPESLVSNTCLHGTVFGTDLMRLLEAANHHVRDYAQMASEESALSAADVVQAQQVAHQATLRAKRAESLARKLARTSVRLQTQLTEATTHKTVLAQEALLLRQQVAAARQTDMERLLEQHVVGALLLHEGQLKKKKKNQQQQQRRRRAVVDEEEKKEEDIMDYELEEDDDLELVCVEDCQSEGRRTPTATQEPNDTADNAAAKFVTATVTQEVVESKTDPKIDSVSLSPDRTNADTKVKVATTEKMDNPKQKDAPVAKKVLATTTPAKDKNTPETPVSVKDVSTKDKENNVTSAHQKDNTKVKSSSAAKGLGSITLSASQYAPVQLYPGYYGRSQSPSPSSKKQQQPTQKTSLSPLPPTKAPTAREKPSSSRSISSATSQSSRSPPVQEHVGSKVFNFLFHPEKIGQQEREAQLQQQHQQQHPQPVNTAQKGNATSLRPNPRTKKLNPLLQLDDFLFGSGGDDENQCNSGQKPAKEAVSDDGTVATLAATTTPASSCINKLDKATENPANKGTTNFEEQQSPCAFPNCVSFADDNISVESNLQSPSLQPSPKNSAKVTRTIVDVDEVIAAAIANSQTNKMKGKKEEELEGNVGLYKDLKVFHSLAIPTEDEINDYHDLQDQQQLLLPQCQPALEPTKQ